MLKMILGFVALFAFVYFALETFRVANKREKIKLIKSLGYTMFITVIVTIIIATIVIMF